MVGVSILHHAYKPKHVTGKLMKLIPLSKGFFTKVDDEDFDLLNQWKWRVHSHHSGTYYAARTARVGYKKRKKVSMHRFLMNIFDPKIQVDHIDNDKLNNQKSNLRIASNKENSRNRKGKKNSTSKYCGVHKRVSKKTYTTKRGVVTNIQEKWIAKIVTDEKELYLGSWPLTEQGEISAAKAYDEAAKIYHKEFANLNFK